MSEPFTAPDVARQLEDCTFCPKMCRHACPVSTTSGRETYIPQAKMALLGRLRRGTAPWTVEATDPLWACTGCRHCTMYCEHDNEPGLVLLAGRAAAQRQGVGHPALADYAERFANREVRLARKLREQFDDSQRADSGGVGFWPGCDMIDKGGADIAATLAVLDRMGGEPVTLIDAGLACAGYPLLAAGMVERFRWQAGKVASALRRFRTVVINCSACRYTLQAQYPGEGLTVTAEVLSLAEYLAARSEQLPPARGRRSVYYHDPCYHARHVGIFAQPRKVLAAFAEVRELTWSGQDTECCGGGGLLPKTMPAVADGMARRRLAEVATAGGGLVVTSCGTCAFMLRRNAPASVEVADLPTAIAMLSDTAVNAPAGVAHDEEP